MYNIVSHATTYSPQGGSVTIAVGRRGAEAWVAVRDQGIGVPAAAPGRGHRPRRKRQPPAHSRHRRGAAYRQSDPAALQDGRLEVQSVKGHGTTVTILLPLDPLP